MAAVFFGAAFLVVVFLGAGLATGLVVFWTRPDLVLVKAVGLTSTTAGA